MNKTAFDVKSLNLLYFRYKDSKLYGVFIFVVIILVGFLLAWWIVLPEIQKYISIQDEVNALNKRITLLNENLNYVKSSDLQKVQEEFETGIAGLPSDKDFEGILNAISSSALRSGVALDSFNINIGKLATESGSMLKGIPVKLGIKTNVATAMQFVSELNQKVPVSDITAADISEKEQTTASSIQVSFYYKPLENVVFHDDAPIPHLSDSDKALLEKIKTWKDGTNGIQDLTVISSASAGL